MVNLTWKDNSEKQKPTSHEYRAAWRETFGKEENYQGSESLDTAVLNDWHFTNNPTHKGLVHPSDVRNGPLYITGLANCPGSDYDGRRITSRPITSIDVESDLVITADAQYTLGEIADHFSEYMDRVGMEILDYATNVKG